MNHYERLKVSPDAPAEVIRAAYRALAAKLHPDRQSGGAPAGPGGPDDAKHSQMASLNAAYEVLIDPKLRQEYDITLQQAPARAPRKPPLAGHLAGRKAGKQTGDDGDDDNNHGWSNTRVDLDWMPPGVASTATPLWPPSRRMMLIGGSALAVFIVGSAGVMWQVMGQHQMERAMSDQFSPGAAIASADSKLPVPPAAATALMPPGVHAEAGQAQMRRKPTVEELQRMSDEELLKVLPTLDDDSDVVGPLGSGGKHPLDGRPMILRTEGNLVDPLAPDLPTSLPPANALTPAPLVPPAVAGRN